MIEIRPYSPSTDRAFVFGSWLQSLRFEDKLYRLVPSEIFYGHYDALIEACLARESVSVRIASLKEDSDILIGYIVDEGETLHWLCVKEAWRKLGIARRLIGNAQYSESSHLSKTAAHILQEKKQTILFNPFNFLKGKS